MCHDDFRSSAVCRRFKKSTYEPSVITRCVEGGGVTDRTRGEEKSYACLLRIIASRRVFGRQTEVCQILDFWALK